MMSLDKQALETLRKDGDSPGSRYQTRKGQLRRRWRFAAIAALVAVVLVLVLGRPRPLEAEVVAASPPLSAGQVAVLSASGYVVARRLATVSAKVTGRVVEVTFEEGGSVEEGQELARLDDATVRAGFDVALRQRDAAALDLNEVEVRLAQAIRDRDRLRALREQGLVSASALDGAEADAMALGARLEASRAALAVATSNVRLRSRDLDDLVVRAPFSGVVISKDAQPGEMVSPISAGGGYTRTGIATIVDMASREIEVDVNEAYINRVQDGQRAEAILDSYPDWKIPARVIAIVPAADRQKATVRVRIAIDQLDPRILPDMGVKVRFFDDRPANGAVPVASLPSGAVLGEQGSTYVWRVIDGRAVRTPVLAGEESEGTRQVLEGLAIGDEVVVGPPATIAEGTRIRPRSAA
jgi:RND family efflux transporter MFP subunit